jgi:hypothetical protein
MNGMDDGQSSILLCIQVIYVHTVPDLCSTELLLYFLLYAPDDAKTVLILTFIRK